MTVTVPVLEKTGAAALQAQITTLAARSDTASQQLLNQRQIDLVNTLMAQQKLNASAILSTVTYSGTLPVLSQITATQAKAAALASSSPAISNELYKNTIPQLQVQAVQELMASGQMPASVILATMSYVGAPAR